MKLFKLSIPNLQQSYVIFGIFCLALLFILVGYAETQRQLALRDYSKAQKNYEKILLQKKTLTEKITEHSLSSSQNSEFSENWLRIKIKDVPIVQFTYDVQQDLQKK